MAMTASFKQLSRRLKALVLGAAFMCSGPLYASGLPAEHEAARLMLAVEAAVAGENWSRAELSLISLKALQTELPVEHFYYSGLVNKQAGKLSEAQSELEQYVIAAGSEAAHYRQALELLTAIELQQTQSPSQAGDESAAKSKPSNAIQTQALGKALNLQSESRAYIDSLKSLYLTRSAKAALLAQANSLLNAHAYTGSRLQTRAGREGLRYSLSIQGERLQLQSKRFRDGLPTLSSDSLSVLGLDPFLNSRCSKAEQACWLFHPGERHSRWLMIEYDEEARSELVKVLSLLIRQIQAG